MNINEQSPGIQEDTICEFLLENPDFLTDHPEVLEHSSFIKRNLGNNVHDFQTTLIERLKYQVEESAIIVHELVETSRGNLSAQKQIHGCIVRLLDAQDMDQVMAFLLDEMTGRLGLDAVAFGIEVAHGVDHEFTKGTSLLPQRMVDEYIPNNQPMALTHEEVDLQHLFGPATPLIYEGSGALIRLNVGEAFPPALVGLGSRDPARFTPHQAHDLLLFLGRSLSRILRIHFSKTYRL